MTVLTGINLAVSLLLLVAGLSVKAEGPREPAKHRLVALLLGLTLANGVALAVQVTA